MKNLIIIFLTVSTCTFSQKYIDSIYSFKLKKRNIIWQKVFESEETDTKNLFKINVLNKFKAVNLIETKNSISFSAESEIINIKKYGGSAMFSAFFIQEENNYFVNIDFKVKKYRITIRNLTSATTSAAVKINLEDYILSKNKIKNNKFNRKNLKIYDEYFTEKFSINLKKEDW